MKNIEQLNEAYGIAGQVNFASGKGEMPVVTIANADGEASIALQGAHVLGFQAKGQAPLIWMSEEATFAPGKSLRGGVPICWPWFGPHASDASLPGHGPARTVDWQPITSASLKDGRTRISFELMETEKTRQMCAYPLRVQLHVTVGSSLSLALETTNLGDADFTLGAALHTYFSVGDVRLAHIEGLDSCEYIDKMDGGLRKQQHGSLSISEETDRIYLGTGSRAEIADPLLGRKIIIESSGSASTVVWNPWIETANNMGDLGTDGYLNMLCVETANAADDVVQLAAGATHRMRADYSSEAL
ncbi:MAG: D-hexose-6-phosphate mutarotase [Mariprofundaceae bacterium]|nr:D-hexose-6-phosphate mutarotase [Mariprofundaceae bacterium]